jgi:hypothetical protein
MTTPEHRAGFRQPLRFPTPASVPAAERRILELQQGIGEIEAQLADKNRRTVEGRRLTAEEYHGWRRSAISALTLKGAELRYCRAWLKARSRPTTAREILADLVVVVGELRLDGAPRALQTLGTVLERAKTELGLG